MSDVSISSRERPEHAQDVPVLAVNNLEVVYSDVMLVLRGVSLEMASSSIVAILGTNGAGKTTLLRAITGLLAVHRGKITKGTIEFQGREIHHRDAPSIVRAGVAQVPQGRGTFADLTVEENLRVGAYTRRDAIAEDLATWYGVFPRLAERREQKAGGLSGGEQQMLAIARALMSRPKLLLCDEPSLGLAPIITKELFEVIGRLNREQGLSVLLVEQNANLAVEIAHRVYLLETGRFVASGTAEQISSDDSIRKAYLGY